MGLDAPQHVEFLRTRARTCVPYIGRQIPNHCTPGKSPELSREGLVWAGQAKGVKGEDGRRRIFKANVTAWTKPKDWELHTLLLEGKVQGKECRRWGWKCKWVPRSKGLIHSTDIHWGPTMYQTLFEAKFWEHRDEHMICPHSFTIHWGIKTHKQATLWNCDKITAIE